MEKFKADMVEFKKKKTQEDLDDWTDDTGKPDRGALKMHLPAVLELGEFWIALIISDREWIVRGIRFPILTSHFNICHPHDPYPFFYHIDNMMSAVFLITICNFLRNSEWYEWRSSSLSYIVILDPFAFRQFDNPNYSGSKISGISKQDFIQKVWTLYRHRKSERCCSSRLFMNLFCFVYVHSTADYFCSFRSTKYT